MVAIAIAVLFVVPKHPRSTAAPAGTLFVNSIPSGAVVLLDGQLVGETPWAGDNAPGGVNTIVLRRPGFKDTTFSIDGGLDWSGTIRLTRVSP